MKKISTFIVLMLALWGAVLFVQDNLMPNSWHYDEQQDKFTQKVTRRLYGKVNSEKFLGFSCNNQKVTLSYLQSTNADVDANDDFGDLYIQVDKNKALKFDTVLWTRYDKLVGVSFSNEYQKKPFRELLIELQGAEGSVSIGFRGQRVDDNAVLGSSGVTESIHDFLKGCNIRLDKWPDSVKETSSY